MPLTPSQARGLILGRQGLVDRHPDPIAAARAVVVIQTQYALSLCPALYARAHGVTAPAVDALLQDSRELVKTWCHRFTVHTFAREDYGLLNAALGPTFFRRFIHSVVRSKRFEADDYERVADGLRRALAEGPLTRTGLHEHLPDLKNVAGAGWGMDVMGLAYRGELVFAAQGGSRTQFALVKQWLPEYEHVSPDDAHAELLRRYLFAHGPATIADFRYWTGLSAVTTTQALRNLADEVTRVEIEGRKAAHYVLNGDIQRLEPAEPTVRLLAKFDPLVMGWQDKSLFLPDRLRDRVIRPAGQIEATILLDDQLHGTWRLQRKGTRAVISVEWFAEPGVRKVKRVTQEAEGLGHALGFDVVDLAFSCP